MDFYEKTCTEGETFFVPSGTKVRVLKGAKNYDLLPGEDILDFESSSSLDKEDAFKKLSKTWTGDSFVHIFKKGDKVVYVLASKKLGGEKQTIDYPDLSHWNFSFVPMMESSLLYSREYLPISVSESCTLSIQIPEALAGKGLATLSGPNGVLHQATVVGDGVDPRIKFPPFKDSFTFTKFELHELGVFDPDDSVLIATQTFGPHETFTWDISWKVTF